MKVVNRLHDDCNFCFSKYMLGDIPSLTAFDVFFKMQQKNMQTNTQYQWSLP